MFQYYTSMLILCWMSLLTLCILVHENDRIPKDRKRLLYISYVMVTLSSIAEWLGIRLDGQADLPYWVLRLVKCADYILTPMAGGFLVLQMQLKNRWQKLIVVVLAFNTVFQVLSMPGGWMVSIDNQNHYTHGPLFPVYLGVNLLMVAGIIAQFIIFGRTFKNRNRASLFAAALVVLAGIAIQELVADCRIVYLGMTLSDALMFIHYSEFSQLAADERLTEQRIQIMLSQIKPHFLYNTLGSIEALCSIDPGAAKLATRKFSQYLRGNMNSLTGENMIPFEKELQHTRLYLELEQVRFEDALQVEYAIEAHDFFLPPLTLEPIVENAVRHGVRGNEDGRGSVVIATAEYPDRFELRVTDDGPGFGTQATRDDGETHIGLNNVEERVKRICGGSLLIASAPGKGTTVTIVLPKGGQKC